MCAYSQTSLTRSKFLRGAASAALFTSGIRSQSKAAPAAFIIDPTYACGIDNAAIIGQLECQPAGSDVLNIIKSVTTAISLPANFSTCCANVPAVHSYYDPDTRKRYIFYNAEYIVETRAVGSGAETYIFAHEVGHHLCGHFTHDVKLSREEQEIQADRFAGFILHRMKYEPVDAIDWLERFAPVDAQDQYPARESRTTAVQDGWTTLGSDDSAIMAQSALVNIKTGRKSPVLNDVRIKQGNINIEIH